MLDVMSVAVIAVFPVHPDKIDEFLTLFRAVLPDTRAFEGCELIETYIDQSDPGRVVVWERWPTKGPRVNNCCEWGSRSMASWSMLMGLLAGSLFWLVILMSVSGG